MKIVKDQFFLLNKFLRSGFKKILLICAAGFLLSAVIGVVVGLLFPQVVIDTVNSFSQTVAESGIENPDGSYSALGFIAHNWSAMLTSACYGFIPFLFLPVISIFSNGFLMGIMAALYIMTKTSLVVYFAGLFPHGVFELPAMILSDACGIYLCLSLVKLICRSFFREPFVDVLSNSLRVMLLLVAPATIIAGFLEAYVTPWFMSLFM